MLEGALNVAQLRQRYTVYVFELTRRNYAEAAKRLGIDWRTVRTMVEGAGGSAVR